MVRSLVALVVRRVLTLLLWRSGDTKDLEILVLHHQLQVLDPDDLRVALKLAKTSLTERVRDVRVDPGVLNICCARQLMIARVR